MKCSTYVLSEVNLGLRVSIGLTLHLHSVALFDLIGVEKGEGRFLGWIWTDTDRRGTGENSSIGFICTVLLQIVNQ